jgi:methylphosphotriester-DNA--protein-cysteine methyltransferase
VTRAFGYQHTLGRILRMRRLLEEIDVYGSVGGRIRRQSWDGSTRRDRDFKRHTGVTPGRYLAAQRSTYDRTEAATSAGFVPDVE